MKKSLLLLGGLLVLSSCQDDNLQHLSSGSESENTEEITSRYAIPVDSALSYLNEFLYSEESATRGEYRRKVSEVFPVKYASITTRAHAVASECDNLIYVANFENDEGYAILAADERISDKVIAVTEQGNMNQATVLAASQPPIADRPIYKDYPLVGAGFFTLPEYEDELFMNPNTVSLQIDSVGDTLVGNFEGDLINDGLNGNGDSVNGVSSTDLFSVSLCTSYATQEIGDAPGTGKPIIPYQPVEPEPGGDNSQKNRVTVTKSGWTIKQLTSSLLSEYVDWHQRSPFNNLYPKKRKGIIVGNRKKAPAGCFPLAIAKILTHFQIPSDFPYWNGLKSKSALYVDSISAAELLYRISKGCGSWYFQQGTFTFPFKVDNYLRKV